MVLTSAALGCGSRSDLPYYNVRTEDAGVPDGDIPAICEGTNPFYSKIGTNTLISESDDRFPSITRNGNKYLAGWSDGSDIYLRSLSEDGKPIGEEARIDADNNFSSSPTSVACTKNVCAISWMDERDGDPEIYLRIVSKDGELIGQDVRVTNNTGFSNYPGYPKLVGAENEFGLIWEDYDGIYFNGISENGTLIGPNKLITDFDYNTTGGPSLAWSKDRYGVSFVRDHDGNREIYFMTLSKTGEQNEPEIPITNDINDSAVPSLVGTGDGGFAVSWMDNRNGFYNIYFNIIPKDGVLTDSAVRITDNVSLLNYPHPALAVTSHGYAVSWDKSDFPFNVNFKHFSGNGEPFGTDLIISDNFNADKFEPSLACGGEGCVSIWSGSNYKISSAHVGCEL